MIINIDFPYSNVKYFLYVVLIKLDQIYVKQIFSDLYYDDFKFS